MKRLSRFVMTESQLGPPINSATPLEHLCVRISAASSHAMTTVRGWVVVRAGFGCPICGVETSMVDQSTGRALSTKRAMAPTKPRCIKSPQYAIKMPARQGFGPIFTSTTAYLSWPHTLGRPGLLRMYDRWVIRWLDSSNVNDHALGVTNQTRALTQPRQ